jgi:putative ubiquitin-RnfH superfamily antitoxin RatB of RatAB toxin-antitoxin module
MITTIQVTVCDAPAARQVREVSLTLAQGATVQDALAASGLCAPDVNVDAGSVGVWGRKAALTHALREGDRVEIWRPLQVDPKLARRERFGKQGARTAGLFAQRRPGAKPGY